MAKLMKTLLGISAVGAACAGAAVYLKKQKETDPAFSEEFEGFEDNLRETASAAKNVASLLKEKVEESVEKTVQKVKEQAEDLKDSDIFETEIFEDVDDLDEDDIFEDVKEKAEDVVEDVKEAAEDIFEETKEVVENIVE